LQGLQEKTTNLFSNRKNGAATPAELAGLSNRLQALVNETAKLEAALDGMLAYHEGRGGEKIIVPVLMSVC
jgi:hypothetical protein